MAGRIPAWSPTHAERTAFLTALARGVDILAAEDERKGWDVVSPLPLPLDLHQQAFDHAAAMKLRALIGAASSPPNAERPAAMLGGSIRL